MANKGKISVIIPNFNYARFLTETIESVLQQSYRNIELIVVNNGSTDNSLEILAPLKDQIILIDQPNLGQSGARNAGLRKAQGDFIAFLDADDYWIADKLEKQVELIGDNNQLIYSGISRFKDDDRRVRSVVEPAFRGDCSQFFLTCPGVSIVLSGESTALFTRSLLRKVGDFDENLNGAAGWDFFRRCSKYTNFDFVPEPLTHYRLHSSNMSNSSNKTIIDIRKAYTKTFSDENWSVSSKQIRKITRTLEFSFLKTYLREFNFRLAFASVLKLLKFNPWTDLKTPKSP